MRRNPAVRTVLLPSLLLPALLLASPSLTRPACASPDTVASVRARAHQEIAQRDATIAALQQKVDAQQKEIDGLHQTFTEALQSMSRLRALLSAAGIVLPNDGSSNPLDVYSSSAHTSPLPGFPDGSAPPTAASSPLALTPPMTAQTYRYIPPPGDVPASLLRFQKIVDRYVKLNPDVITPASLHHGHIEWVRVVDAQKTTSIAYPYTVDAEVHVSYPADPENDEDKPFTTTERPSFQVNPSTKEVGAEGTF